VKFQNEFGIFNMGSLTEAKDHARQSQLLRKMPARHPVLTAWVDEATFSALLNQIDAPGNVGFGAIFPPDGKVLTILMQKGTVQVYWLVDMSDPEIWAAIDAWKREGVVPLALIAPEESNWDMWAGTCELQFPLQLEEFRKFISTETHHVVWIGVCALAAAGILQRQATTDIPGVPVEHVHVNALKTRRSAKFDARMPNLNTRID
jgi:hypothetical protein